MIVFALILAAPDPVLTYGPFGLAIALVTAGTLATIKYVGVVTEGQNNRIARLEIDLRGEGLESRLCRWQNTLLRKELHAQNVIVPETLYEYPDWYVNETDKLRDDRAALN